MPYTVALYHGNNVKLAVEGGDYLSISLQSR